MAALVGRDLKDLIEKEQTCCHRAHYNGAQQNIKPEKRTDNGLLSLNIVSPPCISHIFDHGGAKPHVGQFKKCEK